MDQSLDKNRWIKNLDDTFTKRTGGIGGYKTTPTIILCSGIIQTKDDVKSLIANKIVRQTVLNTRYSKTSINYENTYKQGKKQCILRLYQNHNKMDA